MENIGVKLNYLEPALQDAISYINVCWRMLVQLPLDEILKFKRFQVEILPNFRHVLI